MDLRTSNTPSLPDIQVLKFCKNLPTKKNKSNLNQQCNLKGGKLKEVFDEPFIFYFMNSIPVQPPSLSIT